MSNERLLGCDLCNIALVIGKESTPLYYREAETLIALGEFLEHHVDHPLFYYTLYVRGGKVYRLKE